MTPQASEIAIRATAWCLADGRQRAAADVADYEDFAQRVKGQNFTDAVVLGMGGSSLGAEVFARTFGAQRGFPQLLVLDSTDPAKLKCILEDMVRRSGQKLPALLKV